MFLKNNRNFGKLLFSFVLLIGLLHSQLKAQDVLKNSAKGSILVEYWWEINFANLEEFLKHPKFPFYPNEHKYLNSFEIPKDQAENYASRIRGFIFPPETGDYIFWIAADDCGELWLSENEFAKNKKKICEQTDWAGSREWEKFPQQKSKPIRLEKDKKYYIEALHKEVGGGDNIAVAWQLPNGTKEMPIPGNRLSPSPVLEEVPGTIMVEYWRNVNGGGIKELTSYVDFPDRPNEFNLLNSFEMPTNQGESYGSRISGYVIAPETGEYTFWLSADDAGQLWLSNSENPSNKKKIAYLDEWVLANQYDKLPSQKSGKIRLEKDKKYYIEALQKEGGVNDHLSVGWQLPSGAKELPIPGKRLIPNQPPKSLAKTSGVSIQITTAPPSTPGYHSLVGTFRYMSKEYAFCTGVYFPEEHFTSKELFPLVTTLHNVIGQIGGVTPDQEQVTSEGMALLMLKDIGADNRHSGDWPAVKANPRKDYKFIGLMPQCPKDSNFNSMPMCGVIVEIINWLERNYRMDPDRVYLTGFSYGGTSTWALSQMFPERFAAIAPLSARLAPAYESSPEILKNVGVWCGVGESDGGFFDSCKQMSDIYKKAGHPNFHFSIIKGGGHHCYQSIYGNPDFWKWLLAQKRIRTPKPK